MNVILALVLIVANYPIYKFFFNMMFDSGDEFWECIRYYFTPDIISLFRREYIKDWTSELKLGCFFTLCGLCVFIEFSVIKSIFGM